MTSRTPSSRAASRSSVSRVWPTTASTGRSALVPKRPCSPRVAVTRYVSTPSAAYLASVPPVPSDSSSGWARTHISRSGTGKSPGDDGLEILARHDESRRRRPRAPFQEREQIRLESRLPVCVERSKRLVHRAVVRPEDLDEVFGGFVPERKIPNGMVDRGGGAK